MVEYVEHAPSRNTTEKRRHTEITFWATSEREVCRLQISQPGLCIKLTSEIGVTERSTRMKNANTRTANMNNDLKASTG